ncbi:MAG: RNA methyltransferase [Nitriliruptorales bacterium]|nr:RNA methyltransferase [Nitriliruptorales bacterium]
MSASSHLRAITARTNPLVQAAVRLHRTRDRARTGRWLAEGPHAVRGALAAAAVETLFVVDDTAAAANVDTVLVTDDVMAKIVTTRTHQGIAAICRRPSPVTDIPDNAPVLCLVQAADPGNVGTAVRTAAHAGFAAVVLTEGSADPFSPRAVRAAAGALPTMPVIEGLAVDDLGAAVPSTRLVALDSSGTRSVFEDLPEAPVLVFGSEAHGLDDELLTRVADIRVIPQHGGQGVLDSLNLAAAVAIATYAAARSNGDRR